MSRVLKTEVDKNASICQKHIDVLGKMYYKYVGYKCSWPSHSTILGRKGYGFKKVKVARNLKALTRPESFYLQTYRDLFFPYGTKICYDCRDEEVDAILQGVREDEFSTPILFKSVLARWNEDNKIDEEKAEEFGARLDDQIIATSHSPQPGPSVHKTPMPRPSAPPPSYTEIHNISTQFSDMSVSPQGTPSSIISTASSYLPAQLSSQDVDDMKRNCLRELLQLGGWQIPNPPPVFILKQNYEDISPRSQRAHRSTIGRCLASVIKLTTSKADQMRQIWNIMKESNNVTKHLPNSSDPDITFSEYILAWNNAQSKARQTEVLSLFAHLYTTKYLKSFNINSTELDGKVPKSKRFNPPLTDRMITKARVHR